MVLTMTMRNAMTMTMTMTMTTTTMTMAMMMCAYWRPPTADKVSIPGKRPSNPIGL